MSKASKLRPCPATGRGITSAECGEQRESQLKCPAGCEHNPFNPAHYDRVLEIETRLDAKCFERFTAQFATQPALHKAEAKATRDGLHAITAFYNWNILMARDREQLTFAQRWEQTGWRDLKNDERVLMRHKMRMHIALLEVHRVLDGSRVEMVDLLAPDPQPLIFQDRRMAAMATRFQCFLAWIYPLPHYWRSSGTATTVESMGDLATPDVVREIVRHLGGPVTEPELRPWLAEHFHPFNESLNAVARARRQLMFSGMDAKFGKVVYELRAPFAECREQLELPENVVPSDLSEAERNEGFAEAREWLDSPDASATPTMPGGESILGRVLLGQSFWRLETFGSAKLARLREQFERQLGERVRFNGERLDDMASQMAAKEPPVNQSLVPPSLLANPEQFQFSTSRIPTPPPGTAPGEIESQMFLAMNRAFMDEPIPALNRQTPRQAAQDPLLRPKLIALMKQRVQSHDEHNLRTGRTDDINWMLRDLDLKEILFDAPPWRPPTAPPAPVDNEFDDPLSAPLDQPFSDPLDADFPDPVEVDYSRPPAPPLPKTPLSFDESARRLEQAFQIFENFNAADIDLQASGATIMDDIDLLTEELLDDGDFRFAMIFVVQVWFALVPRGCLAPEIDYDELEAAFQSNLKKINLASAAPSPKKLQAFLQSGPQPELMLVLLGGVLEASTKGPADARPSQEGHPVILALLKTVVEQLHQALQAD